MFECPVRLKICKGEGLRKRFSYRELLPYESLPSPLPLRFHLEQREVCEQVTCSSTLHGKGCTKVSLSQMWATGENQYRVSHRMSQRAGRNLAASS